MIVVPKGLVIPQDNPFETVEGRTWCRYDSLRIESGGVVLRYHGRDVYKIIVQEWIYTNELTIQGIEGRTEVILK